MSVAKPSGAVAEPFHEPSRAPSASDRLALLEALEKKTLWLATWLIHHANHVRPKRDGLKVGGHQASSSSAVTLLTALYFDVLQPADRVAVKPHASPAYHAIQYLLGRQTREKLERFRAFGGAQAYPSRTKDTSAVDFSTGSVGLGVAITAFAALTQDYLRLKELGNREHPPGRMVAVAGDAEFDEGNVFEALFESWKHDVRNVWWIVDYNRHSLDGVVADRIYDRIEAVFRNMNWRVVTLKYGTRLERAFREEGGDALRQWLEQCPNGLYSVLTFKGGAAWRERLQADLGDTHGIRHLLDRHNDGDLHDLMTNLAGHDLHSLTECFHGITDDHPTAFIAYTIKGYRLPFAAHKDNHSGLMTPEQIRAWQADLAIPEGAEWEKFAGLSIPAPRLQAFLDAVPFVRSGARECEAEPVPVPPRIELPRAARMSTQETFGRVLGEIARNHPDLANRIVTTSADVTVSTNLGTWVNRRGLFDRRERCDPFRDAGVASAQQWMASPAGQHVELGIAENNLFLMLAALGLSAPLFGTRLLPIGTVYDPFVCRGLDALNYACYQDARFLLVATPSGLALAPEGGAHQSISTPLIGIGQPGLLALEPAYADETCEMVRWSLQHLQEPSGSSVYLRLSTRPVDQPAREMTPDLSRQIMAGGYWLKSPSAGASLAIVCGGALVPDALEAHQAMTEDLPGAGLLVVTSADRLYRDWSHHQVGKLAGESYAHQLLAPLSSDAALVTVLDGHPATLSWLGAVCGHRTFPLGVDRFGQSGDLPDLYHAYGLDAEAILDVAARWYVERHAGGPRS